MAQPEPGLKKVTCVSAKNLGVGPNRHGPNPTSPLDSDDHINSFSYLPSIVSGAVRGPARGRLPSEPASFSARADRPVTDQANPATAPAGSPIVRWYAWRGQHQARVPCIVRENRTYDQILGDVGRGDGDPKLELFGPKVTP